MTTYFALAINFLANINEFDAIVFHTFGFNEETEIPDQRERKPHQRYVMFLKESPLMDWNDHNHLNNFFNWTATYRWDSDLTFTYGWVSQGSVKSKSPTNSNLPNLTYPQGNGKSNRTYILVTHLKVTK